SAQLVMRTRPPPEEVTVPESMVTNVQIASRREVAAPDASVDPTDARNEARRCVGRSDRRAQRHPWLLRSIRPTRARRPFDASVDPTDARYARLKGLVRVRPAAY